MNNLKATAQSISTHITHRKKMAEIKEIAKRNRKAQEYLKEVPRKLSVYYNKFNK